MNQKVKEFLTGGIVAASMVLAVAVPAAGAYFEANLAAWQGRTWIASGTKYSSSQAYYVEVASDSSAGGHFWVDNADGTYIGSAIDLNPGEHAWGAYQDSGRSYSGYATLYGRELGYGPIVDNVKGWQNLNG